MGVNNLFYKKRQRSILYIVLVVVIFLLGIFYSSSPNGFNNRNYSGSKDITKDIIINNKKEDMKEAVFEDDNLPRWNLKDLYLDLDDPNIKEDMNSLEKRINNFKKKYEGKITSISSYELFKALIEYEGINELSTKLLSFAFLNYAQDLSKEANVLFYQNISEKITNLLSNLVFLEVEINSLSDVVIREKVNNSLKLKTFYGEYIKNMRLFKKHQLSVELEKFSLEKSITSNEAWSRLFDETMAGLEFEYNGKTLNESEILEVMYNNTSENVRREASKIFGQTLGKNIKLFAFITNILAKDKEISDKCRKYETPISYRNLSNRMEDDVVENLYNSVQENYSKTSHRYYKLKSKILGKSRLHYSDRNAPLLFNDNKKYEWEEAKNIVLNAYREFSPEMAEIGKLFFDNNWIDVPAKTGKRSGAFAHPSITTVHPYILLNFQGTRRDVLTLAHELGHGIHMYLANKQGFFMSDTPLTLAETASVFGEQLTFRYMLKQETNADKKIILLASKIEDMLNTTVRQIAFLEFEKKVHDERKNGEITINRLNEIWLESQKNSLGDIFDFDDEYKYYWTYIPHFIHSPFYVYSYAFGDCLVNTLYSLYMEKPENFQEKYINLLSAGGSRDYKILLKQFDLNPKDKDFWQKGMNLIIELIDELEKLLKEKNRI